MTEIFLYYNFLPLLADHVLDIPKEHYTNIGVTPRHNYLKFDPNNVKDKEIIFVKTDLLQSFFINIMPYIKTRFYLISGVGGKDVGSEFKNYLNNKQIIKWIGSNLLFQHPKLIKIPIGFEETERCIGGPASGEGGDQNLLKESYENTIDIKNKKNKLLVTYLSKTHSDRNGLIEKLKKHNFVEFANKLQFSDYMKKINEYKFVLCPRGCGTDTHRFWEIILMGSIPVLETCGLDDLYDKFPCLIIQSFDELSMDMLNNFKLDENKVKNIDKYLLLKNFKNEVLNSMTPLDI